MPHKEWEELTHEQKKRQSLRQMGISEDFVTEIVDLLIQAMFQGINGQIGRFLSFDERRELKCSICPEKPYRAWTIMRAKQGSEIYDAIVAVLCKEHFKRVAVRPDIKLIHTRPLCKVDTGIKKKYMNSQRNTAKIIGNKAHLMLLLFSFYIKNFTSAGSNSSGNDVVCCLHS